MFLVLRGDAIGYIVLNELLFRRCVYFLTSSNLGAFFRSIVYIRPVLPSLTFIVPSPTTVASIAAAAGSTAPLYSVALWRFSTFA